MSDTTLAEFVDKALSAGASRADTERALLEAGWAKDEVTDALNSFSDVEFAIPVPRPKARLSARDAFLYLVMFAMLYISAFHLGNLLFQVINLNIPDPLVEGRGARSVEAARDAIRFATSSLIVAFPVFLFTARRIAKGVSEDPTRRGSGVRKWLTYLTMFVSACIIVGDLISLLYSLLAGELTLRVTLKLLVVGLIAGGVFAYYLRAMRVDDEALSQ
ncbi:MAG: DUF5671 domain-containing protein [Pseudomonadota bacterium]